MAVLDGYMPLDFVGFTDKGWYSPAETYMQNDLVHNGSVIWKCMTDGTSGVEPEEGDTWEIFIECDEPYYGTYDTFPRPPLLKYKKRFFVDEETDPRLMYTWREATQEYVLTGGAGGADGSSMDIQVTLPAAGWTGSVAPYQQTVTIPQMREDMTPFHFFAGDDDTERYAYSLIMDYQAGYAQMTFYAADLPEVDIHLTLKGVPAQKLGVVDNTVVFLVEPSAFALNEDVDRYEATIAVEGMTAGYGGQWDIVRSGPVLSLEESRIAASITDVIRSDGAVKIVCLEPPAQRYMMSIAGAYPDAEPGTVVLAGMQEWFDRVEELETTLNEQYSKRPYRVSNTGGSGNQVSNEEWVYLGTNITVPAGCFAIIYAIRSWNTGRPKEVSISTSSSSRNPVASNNSDPNSALYFSTLTAVAIVDSGTYYLFSRAEAGISTERMEAIIFHTSK